MKRFSAGSGGWTTHQILNLLTYCGILVVIVVGIFSIFSRTPNRYFGIAIVFTTACSAVGNFRERATERVPSFSSGLLMVGLASFFGLGLVVAIGAGTSFFWVVFWPLVAGLFFVANIANYNRLIQHHNAVGRDWNSIRILLQRRLDLIDRLLAISKGYQEHERDVFVGIAKARAEVSDSQTVAARLQSEKELGLHVHKFLAVAEAYPDLRSAGLVTSLMTEIVRTEDELAASRSRYNETVGTYNTTHNQFPTIVAAALFNFRVAQYWNE